VFLFDLGFDLSKTGEFELFRHFISGAAMGGG